MHLALGYLAYETNHKDYYVMALLSIILGGNMSSRLFNEVREKRGLAYSISSGIKSLNDTGGFYGPCRSRQYQDRRCLGFDP